MASHVTSYHATACVATHSVDNTCFPNLDHIPHPNTMVDWLCQRVLSMLRGRIDPMRAIVEPTQSSITCHQCILISAMLTPAHHVSRVSRICHVHVDVRSDWSRLWSLARSRACLCRIHCGIHTHANHIPCGTGMVRLRSRCHSM